jgi:hypothetical protein
MDGFKLLETVGLELDLPVISECHGQARAAQHDQRGTACIAQPAPCVCNTTHAAPLQESALLEPCRTSAAATAPMHPARTQLCTGPALACPPAPPPSRLPRCSTPLSPAHLLHPPHPPHPPRLPTCSTPLTPPPPAVMSSNGETGTVLRGVTHGAVDFLIKPVRIEELRNMWQHVLRRRKDVVRHCRGGAAGAGAHQVVTHADAVLMVLVLSRLLQSCQCCVAASCLAGTDMCPTPHHTTPHHTTPHHTTPHHTTPHHTTPHHTTPRRWPCPRLRTW